MSSSLKTPHEKWIYCKVIKPKHKTMKQKRFTHMIDKLNHSKTWIRIGFLFTGIVSTLWFIFRVVPKPSRANYPCMKAAAPVMSGFVIYVISLGGIPLLFKKVITSFKKAKYITAFVALSVLGLLVVAFSFQNSQDIFASTINTISTLDESPNTPIGVGKGIFPGRVVWVMDKDATNENCTNKVNDYWFMDKNTNQAVVSSMLSNGIKKIGGKDDLPGAWDAIFKYFNANHGKGNVGYKSGEKVVIKVNLTTMGSGGRHFNSAMNITPQLGFALLQQLVDSLHIAQSDITFGDPYRGMPDELFFLCYNKYPSIHYIEGSGTDGREKTVISKNDVYFNSDDQFDSRLPQSYLDAAYLINMPCLKTHNSAGITIAAKNHQGSVIGPEQTASSQSMIQYLHYDYPVDGGAANQQMGKYRHIVDYMAHNKLGGNTLVYIVDAIWSGRNWDAQVDKFQMEPFSNDWTSSLFISQDAVAIESVGFDFLYNEYKNYPKSHGNADYPLVDGVQDYIHQAADPANWPAGIAYDPSSVNHTSPVGPLGVHEHWNNANDKQYSRNLGKNNGIELVGVPASLVVNLATSTANSFSIDENSLKIFPNPIKDLAVVNYQLNDNAIVQMQIVSLNGQVVYTSEKLQQQAGVNHIDLNISGNKLKTGSYLCKVIVEGPASHTLISRIAITN